MGPTPLPETGMKQNQFSTKPETLQWFSVRIRTRVSGLSVLEMMVVVLLIALIIMLLIPLIERLQSRSLRTDCSNNLRMIGTALQMYQVRHDGWFPANQKDGSWRTYLDPDLKAPFVPNNWKGTSHLWVCPIHERAYFANNLVIGDNRFDPREFITHWRITQFPRPTRVPVVADALPGEYAKAAIGGYRGVDFRHSGEAVILFMDWRVEAIVKPGGAVADWWEDPVRGEPDKPPRSFQ